MRNGVLAWSFVAITTLCDITRAEIFEVPLPEVVGEYVPGESFPRSPRTRREFEFDLGTPLAEIHDLRLRLEGSITAQLNWKTGASEPVPENLQFAIHLDNDTRPGYAAGWTPSAGRATYPEPMPFTGGYFGKFFWTDWSFLKTGAARGYVELHRPLQRDIDNPSGGSGRITGAWVIIDATPVPEPGLMSFFAVALWSLSRRRPRR